jgi:REP element-mobilizing transposase RayT
MSRPLRLEFPGALYHVTSRGNARQAVFHDDADRHRFLSLLAREIFQHGWHCHAYCLMTNHFHLLVETPSRGLARGMQRLNSGYSRRFNQRHERVGHVFQGRYHSVLVEKESYLLELSRYVVLNPVRAGMVARVERWAWSSFRATAGLAPVPQWLEVSWLLARFGATRAAARAAYRRFVDDGVAATSPLDAVRGQIWLGGETFRTGMQEAIGEELLPEIPHPQMRPSGPTRDELLAAVCEEFGVSEADLRSRAHQEAYRVAAYLLRRRGNLRLGEVAQLFGVSNSRISNIQTAMEAGPPDRTLARLLDRCKV